MWIFNSNQNGEGKYNRLTEKTRGILYLNSHFTSVTKIANQRLVLDSHTQKIVNLTLSKITAFGCAQQPKAGQNTQHLINHRI